MKRRPLTVALVGLTLTLPLLLLFLFSFGKDPRRVPAPLIGAPLPAFDLPALDGGRISSTSLLGKPAVINFWATWCEPCRAEHGLLQQGARAFGARIQFVGIAFDESREQLARFIEQLGSVYPMLIDEGGRAAISFGLTGVPETWFVDAAGVVRQKVAGALTPEVLVTQLGALLADTRPSDIAEQVESRSEQSTPDLCTDDASSLAPTGAESSAELRPQPLAKLSAEPSGEHATLPEPELERRTQALAEQLLCPVCQGSSIADSPTTMARNMKAEVRNLLSRGLDEEQILQHFERSYGEMIRMKPRAAGLNLLLFALPGFALLTGLTLALRTLRAASRGKGDSDSAPPSRDRNPRRTPPAA